MSQPAIPSDLITRRVRVDRSRTPQEALDATGYDQLTDRKVVKNRTLDEGEEVEFFERKVVNNMPRGEGEEVEVVFFKPGCYMGDIADIDKEYELRGLKPCDPYSLAAVNEADPSFADDKPNSTHWKDSDGEYCFCTFGPPARTMCVSRLGFAWDDPWWFAGLRK